MEYRQRNLHNSVQTVDELGKYVAGSSYAESILSNCNDVLKDAEKIKKLKS